MKNLKFCQLLLKTHIRQKINQTRLTSFKQYLLKPKEII